MSSIVQIIFATPFKCLAILKGDGISALEIDTPTAHLGDRYGCSSLCILALPTEQLMPPLLLDLQTVTSGINAPASPSDYVQLTLPFIWVYG